MKGLIVVAMFLAGLSGCAALQADTKAPPAPAADAGANKTITVPNWPMISYVSESGDAFVVLGIKDPKGFPVPVELEFKSKDGKIVKKLKMQSAPSPPPAEQKGEQPK